MTIEDQLSYTPTPTLTSYETPTPTAISANGIELSSNGPFTLYSKNNKLRLILNCSQLQPNTRISGLHFKIVVLTLHIILYQINYLSG